MFFEIEVLTKPQNRCKLFAKDGKIMAQTEFQKQVYGKKMTLQEIEMGKVKQAKPMNAEEQKYQKLKKLNGVKKAIASVFASAILASGILVAANLKNKVDERNDKIVEYIDNNTLFAASKVDKYLDFFGADQRYVLLAGRNLDPEGIYSHFTTEDNSHIKIHISDDFNQTEREHIQIYFDYLNSVFDVINPDYHFVVGDYSKKESQIQLTKATMPKVETGTVGAQTIWHQDEDLYFLSGSSEIQFNNNYDFTNNVQLFKLILAHEMMHVLFQSWDINEEESETFSVYNWGDCDYMASIIKNALPKIPLSYAGPNYTVLNEEEKNSFITYTPVDIATLCALYGEDGREADYIKYIKYTLDVNIRIYDFFSYQLNFKYKYDQPYFEEDFDFDALAAEYFGSDYRSEIPISEPVKQTFEEAKQEREEYEKNHPDEKNDDDIPVIKVPTL